MLTQKIAGSDVFTIRFFRLHGLEDRPKDRLGLDGDETAPPEIIAMASSPPATAPPRNVTAKRATSTTLSLSDRRDERRPPHLQGPEIAQANDAPVARPDSARNR